MRKSILAMLGATVALVSFSPALFAAPLPVMPIKVSASSVLPPSNAGTYAPENVLSSDLSTAWVKGASGSGVGEWLEFSFIKAQRFDSVRICNGYQKSQSTYTNNARAGTLSFVFSNGESRRLTLDDRMECRDYPLTGCGGDWAKLHVETVYPGAKWQDLAVSYIQFFASPDIVVANEPHASIPATANTNSPPSVEQKTALPEKPEKDGWFMKAVAVILTIIALIGGGAAAKKGKRAEEGGKVFWRGKKKQVWIWDGKTFALQYKSSSSAWLWDGEIFEPRYSGRGADPWRLDDHGDRAYLKPKYTNGKGGTWSWDGTRLKILSGDEDWKFSGNSFRALSGRNKGATCTVEEGVPIDMVAMAIAVNILDA